MNQRPNVRDLLGIKRRNLKIMKMKLVLLKLQLACFLFCQTLLNMIYSTQTLYQIVIMVYYMTRYCWGFFPDFRYQKIKLKCFNASRKKVDRMYGEMIDAVSRSVRGRFEEFQRSVVFKNLPVILDVAMWPKEEEALQQYGDQAICELKEFYKALLIQNGCNIDKVLSEWNRLKVYFKLINSSFLLRFCNIISTIDVNYRSYFPMCFIVGLDLNFSC